MIDVYRLAYKKGDVMVLYTDGITEANDGKGEEFGYENLEKTVLEARDKGAKEIQEHLISRLYEYSGTDDINDDFTTMIVRFK